MPGSLSEIAMDGIVEGLRLRDGGEAVEFLFRVDGKMKACMVSRELLNDLSRSTARDDELLAEFAAHQALILEKAEMAIRGNLDGAPLLLPSEMFFPNGRPRPAAASDR
jgi:hypothetical protein